MLGGTYSFRREIVVLRGVQVIRRGVGVVTVADSLGSCVVGVRGMEVERLVNVNVLLLRV